jgi:hypothetical protein
MWKGTPGHPDDRPDARRERLSGSTARHADATGPWWRSHDEGGSE